MFRDIHIEENDSVPLPGDPSYDYAVYVVGETHDTLIGFINEREHDFQFVHVDGAGTVKEKSFSDTRWDELVREIKWRNPADFVVPIEGLEVAVLD
jgi:hypothetical protein